MIRIFDTFVDHTAIDRVSAVLNSTYLSEGRIVAEFEAALSQQLGICNAVAVNSGTSALHLALILAGVKPDDEVILPAQTFIATALAIKYVHARPIFADIDYQTGNISVESIKEKINENTAAIMVVHWGGMPCDMDEIAKLASDHSVPIIEDAAHALGSSYKGKPIGTCGQFTCFSFQAIKHVTTGDGGVVTCTNDEAYKRAKKLRWFGIDRQKSLQSELGERQYDLDEVGFKYHLNDFSAALGIANLKEFKLRLDRLTKIAEHYHLNLKATPGVTLWKRPNDRKSSNWLYGLHVEDRLNFVRAMRARRVEVSVVHQRIDKHSIFLNRFDDLINQSKFDETQIHIPIHSSLTDEDVENITESIKMGW